MQPNPFVRCSCTSSIELVGHFQQLVRRPLPRRSNSALAKICTDLLTTHQTRRALPDADSDAVSPCACQESCQFVQQWLLPSRRLLCARSASPPAGCGRNMEFAALCRAPSTSKWQRSVSMGWWHRDMAPWTVTQSCLPRCVLLLSCVRTWAQLPLWMRVESLCTL